MRFLDGSSVQIIYIENPRYERHHTRCWARGLKQDGVWRVLEAEKESGGNGRLETDKGLSEGELPGTSLVAQWLKTLPANGGDLGSNPGPGRSHIPQSN